jgi:DNA-directed RNA polymerase subunit K/omega
VIQRPRDMGAFEFIVLAALRASQLVRGCVPRVEGEHKPAVTARMEVAAGKVTALRTPQVL